MILFIKLESVTCRILGDDYIQCQFKQKLTRYFFYKKRCLFFLTSFWPRKHCRSPLFIKLPPRNNSFFFHFRSESPVSLRFLGAKWNQNRAYFQVELEFGVLQVFVEGKLSQQRREPTADSTNLGFKPGAHWWRELSILCHHLLP